MALSISRSLLFLLDLNLYFFRKIPKRVFQELNGETPNVVGARVLPGRYFEIKWDFYVPLGAEVICGQAEED